MNRVKKKLTGAGSEAALTVLTQGRAASLGGDLHRRFVHGDVARLFGHPCEPRVDGLKGREVVVAKMSEMRISVECDVGDGVAIGGKVPVPLEVILHHLESAVAFLHPIVERVLLQFAAALAQREPE